MVDTFREGDRQVGTRVDMGDGRSAFIASARLVDANNNPVGGASGPQPATSSQSVTPSSDGAPFPVVGNVADGSLDSGNSVKVAGIYSATRPAMPAGSRVPLQTDTNGNLSVTIVRGALATPVDGGTGIYGGYNSFGGSPGAPAITGSLGYVWTGSATVMARGDTNGAYTISKGGANIATGQVAVGTTATQVVPARAGRQKVTITPTTSTVFYVGAAGITTGTGMYVAAGGAVTLDTAAAVFAVGASAFTASYVELF